LWSKTFASGQVYSIQETADSGYVLSGYTTIFGGGNSDAYIIKADSSGSHIWAKTFGGSDQDAMYSVQETTDGGYIFTGGTHSFSTGWNDAYLIKTDESGNHLWSKTFGGSMREYAYSVQETTDGGYIMAGLTSSFGAEEDDVYIIKTDESGNHLWSKTFGGSRWEYTYSIKQTTDGGYIVAGSTNSFGRGWGNFYIIKTDSNGNCPEANNPEVISIVPVVDSSTPTHESGTPTHESNYPVHDPSEPVYDPGEPS
jgi:hypothetical protein